MADARFSLHVCSRLTAGPVWSGVGLLLAAFGIMTAPAQDALQIRTNYYGVAGETLGEIHRAMSRLRPRSETGAHDGLTTWHIDWRVWITRRGGMHQLGSFTTRTTITLTMPRWLPPTNAAPELVRTWTNYLAALWQHEMGHVQLVRTTVAEMHKQAQTVPPGTDATALRQQIDSATRSILADSRQKHRDYDARTKHGATQGAVLPSGRRSPPPR